MEEILHDINKPLPTIIHEERHPGDRDDNLWITIDDYKPPTTQNEWEKTCFLDKSYNGYYNWPKIIKYPINKRQRYTSLDDMPENVAILYNRFIDKSFLMEVIELMVLDEEDDDDINFTEIRFAMFKVYNKYEHFFFKSFYYLFKGLFRNFGLTFLDNFMEGLYKLIHEKSKEKQIVSHLIASEIVAGIIRGSKYWTLEMVKEILILFFLSMYFI